MLFNSIPFICVFVPAVVALYFLLGRLSADIACLWLCAASIAFYGYWNVRYVPLLLGSIGWNYVAGSLIGRNSGPRAYWLLTAAVAGDLLLLGYYKYANFFADTIQHLGHVHLAIAPIVLPLGISFFTFTQIAYLVDAYRGKVHGRRFTHYLLFVTYFPHLIAGPILHHAQMMPQFAERQNYRVQWPNMATGITMFILGLGKKVVLADQFAVPASIVFGAVAKGDAPSMIEAWLGTLAYTLQLYFDFSGYCDMAIGVSLMLNIRLPINFNSPYKAVNIIDFWRRWHITLSAFLRDYLYIPLGGNRYGKVRRYTNLFGTMLLGGLWHGAGWTFVLWGGLHGLYLVCNHAFHAWRKVAGRENQQFGATGRFFSAACTFVCVAAAWALFRAEDLPTAHRMLAGLGGANGFASSPALGALVSPWTLIALAAGYLIVWTLPNTQEWMRLLQGVPATSEDPSNEASFRWHPSNGLTGFAFGVVLALMILYIARGAPSEFLYFQF